jgi:flagellar hook assembly protein FlgD
VSKNVFSNKSTVLIQVPFDEGKGLYDLTIYNSAGEQIKKIDLGSTEGIPYKTYAWDGKNKYGDLCASGVYVIYLTKPLSTKLARILFIR